MPGVAVGGGNTVGSKTNLVPALPKFSVRGMDGGKGSCHTWWGNDGELQKQEEGT